MDGKVIVNLYLRELNQELLYDKSIVKNKSEPISIYEIVRICYVW